PESNKETQEQGILPPTPLTGGARSGSPKRSKFKSDEILLTDEAMHLYNATASRLGFSKVTDRGFSDARRTRLLKRLTDIGGIDGFRIALETIEHVPFLMGQAPPKPGMAPFKLDFDRLLQTQGDFLGDILAKLIDKAAHLAEQ